MTKDKWLGALLNFLVPGLGQFYARKTIKSILIYVLFFIVVLNLRFIAYNFQLFLVSLTLIAAYWLYLVISGYRDVEQGAEYEPARMDKWYVYVGVVLFHSALIGLAKGHGLDTRAPINFARIPTPAMDPALKVGDHLVFRKVKSPDRNDVTILVSR